MWSLSPETARHSVEGKLHRNQRFPQENEAIGIRDAAHFENADDDERVTFTDCQVRYVVAHFNNNEILSLTD